MTLVDRMLARRLVFLIGLAGCLVVTACSPAPTASPTAAPAKPTTAASPAAVASSPAPAVAGSPAASPAAVARVPDAASAAPAIDQSLAAVWQGKNVTIIVGDAAGGSNDTIARLISRHLPRNLPGQPTVIVQNMPGAAHRVATNFVYQSKPDGLTIGAIDRGIPNIQLRGEGPDQGVRYDVTKMTWLGTATPVNQVILLHQRSGVSLDNLKVLETKQALLAGTEASSSAHVPQVVLNNGLGWKLKSVFGYEGTNARLLAIERAEVEGILAPFESMVRQVGDNLRSGAMIPIIAMGRKPADPLLAKTPNAEDLFADKSVEKKQLLAIVTRPYEWGRPLVAAPDLPPNITATLRAALLKTYSDPEFLAEARQIDVERELAPVTGEKTTEMILEYMKTPKELVDLLDKLVTEDTPS